MLGKSNVYFFSDQIEIVDAVAQQIIIADLSMKPNGRLVCIQRIKKLLFLLLKH